MKYLGRLKDLDLTSFSEEEKLKLYSKRRLFEKRDVITLSFNTQTTLNENNTKSIIEPRKVLIDDYYGFLVRAYGNNIEDECMLYLHPFNELTFGMEHTEAKKVARQYYFHIAREIKESKIKLVRFDPTATGTKRVSNTTPLEECKDKQNTLKYRSVNEFTNGLEQFLMGKIGHFTPSLIATVPILSEIIRFEGGLKSIIALNEDFSFEEGTFFDQPDTAIHTDPESIAKKLMKKANRNSIPTNKEARDYLISTLFRGKKE